MEIHRELGKGHDEVIYKDALVIELSRAEFRFGARKITKSHTKELSCLTDYYADFVVWDKILFEAKAVEKLTDSHIKHTNSTNRGEDTNYTN